MSERDLNNLHRRAVAAFYDASRSGNMASDAEAALRGVTEAAFECLGDREAHLRPGALKPGEQQFFVSGVFLVTPGEDGHLLVAENGFPPEQHRLQIPIDIGHPGWVYEQQVPLILENTDEHADFKQILKTARMGSALYGPMIWQGKMIGQLLMAGQARNTFAQPDLDILVGFAGLATALYVAHHGEELLQKLAKV